MLGRTYGFLLSFVSFFPPPLLLISFRSQGTQFHVEEVLANSYKTVGKVASPLSSYLSKTAPIEKG